MEQRRVAGENRMKVEMRVGDLVRMPLCAEYPEVVGVVTNLTHFHRGRIGVAWMDGDGSIDQEPYSSLEVISATR
jgi:hypothetical protein